MSTLRLYFIVLNLNHVGQFIVRSCKNFLLFLSPVFFFNFVNDQYTGVSKGRSITEIKKKRKVNPVGN